ncbi:hypothetical protein [Arthrobacter mobilis]|uniref:Uncharacterized protein n=1 Tax=Arthrobacter mobilis TaxID=2724944 RepID=A0A7X6K4U3_9MICC|nr:hypothetical protein [Arthrobacter mobilis]NKX55732.1 hypothetical protein [Arthrobacter mobilis]
MALPRVSPARGSVGRGRENGLLIYRNGSFTKVPSPDGYGRIGNQAGSEHSTVVLGDDKTGGRTRTPPRRVALVVTASAGLPHVPNELTGVEG